MVSTRKTLTNVATHLLESMGARSSNEQQPSLAPVTQAKDIGRRPSSAFGTLAIEQIIPDPGQPRAEFSEESLSRLADSLRNHGQLAPIRVRWSDQQAKWIIIAGERRWRAAKLAGLATIDCYFDSDDMPNTRILEQQIIENLLREDLKPVEQAKAFLALMELNKWNGKQVAERLCVPPSQVSRSLALLRLPADLQGRVDAGEIPARTAYELSKVNEHDQQRKLAIQAADGRLTHEDTAKLVRHCRGKRQTHRSCTSLSFVTENGWKVVATAIRKGTYEELESALQEVLEEVQHRIANNVQLF